MGNIIRNRVKLISDNEADVERVIKYLTTARVSALVKDTVIYKDVINAISIYLSSINPNNHLFNSAHKIIDEDMFVSIYNKVLAHVNEGDVLNICIDGSYLSDSKNHYYMKLGKIIVLNIVEYDKKCLTYPFYYNEFDLESNSEITFNTTWSAKLETTKTLSAIFPNVTFEHHYTDTDDFGYTCGYEVWKNGELIVEDTFNGGSKEAYEFSAKVIGKTLEELHYKWDDKNKEYFFDWDAFENG